MFFRSRQLFVDEASHRLLRGLVALGGYYTVQQANSLLSAGPGLPARARLRMLERLGFLRRVSK